MSEFVTRMEFDELADKVDAQGRTNRVILRELGEMKALMRQIARHLGIDPNGDRS